MIRIHKAVAETEKNYKISYSNHFWYTVHAPNGKILVTSETFTRKANCYKGIESLQKVMKSKFEIIDETK